jgi:glycosyltransferase involved in cell wall biosynthesis
MVGLRGIPATYGGVEAAVEALSVRLVERGHDVTVYARTSYRAERPTSVRGVSLRYLPQVDTKHLEAASHTLLAVVDALRRGFDVVHIHASGPALFSPLPRIARTPCVATVHALDWRREKWGGPASAVLRLGARVAATVPDRTIVVSRRLERELRERYGASPAYIPNGVDIADFAETTPIEGLSPGFMLFLGRLVPEKGVHTLIEAYGRTDLEQPLVIAGPASHSGDYVERIRSLAERDPRVRFAGPRFGAEKAWLLRHAGVFVQPSTLEGMPIALLEALACGCNAVVSDIPEHLEVLDRDPRAARVFRARDAGDLASKLAQAATERPDLDHSQRARLLEPYDWTRIAAETESVYREAIEGRASRRRAR